MRNITSIVMAAAWFLFTACGADGVNGIHNSSYSEGLSTDSAPSEQWSGHWSSSNGIDRGTLHFDLTQGAAVLKGSASMSGFPCMTDGDISGTSSGSSMTFDVTSVSGKDVINFSGTSKQAEIQGRYVVINWQCTLDHGTFRVTRS